jgi:hypothetical protein
MHALLTRPDQRGFGQCDPEDLPTSGATALMRDSRANGYPDMRACGVYTAALIIVKANEKSSSAANKPAEVNSEGEGASRIQRLLATAKTTHRKEGTGSAARRPRAARLQLTAPACSQDEADSARPPARPVTCLWPPALFVPHCRIHC